MEARRQPGLVKKSGHTETGTVLNIRREENKVYDKLLLLDVIHDQARLLPILQFATLALAQALSPISRVWPRHEELVTCRASGQFDECR